MLNKDDAKSFITKKQPSGSSYKIYTFECSECKSDIKAQLGQMKRHSGKCVSCARKGRPYEHIINELKHSCNKTKRLEVTINYEEFVEIIKDSKCHYCDKELVFNKHTRDSSGDYVSRAYQLDRKDNNLGYTKENVVPCCWNCNRMKSDIYTYEEFKLLSPILKEIHKNK